MSRAVLVLALALLAAPAAAYVFHRLARGLGFLDPPLDRQHEHRRTILVALYALLLFLPVLLYGYGTGWPRAWAFLGIASGLALAVTGALGIRSAFALWRMRHPR
jgi:hypothetical protein